MSGTRKLTPLAAALLLTMLLTVCAQGQFVLTKEQMIA